MKLIPKKTFLLRQDKIAGSKKRKDVIATKGVAIEVTDEEAVKFYGYFDMSKEEDKKKVKKASQENPELLRTV